MINFLMDFLFPKFCLGCKREKTYLCENCEKQIRLDGKIYPANNFLNGLFCACVYEENGLLAELIHQFKYNSASALIEILKDFLINTLKICSLGRENLMKNSIVIPVPLHKKRHMQRGFNQSELLAQKIAEKFSLLLDADSLTRIRNTKPQAFLQRKERLTNVLDAFLFKNPETKYQKILLVDDVVGTGSTLNEAAKAIKEIQPDTEIFGITLAKGVK